MAGYLHKIRAGDKSKSDAVLFCSLIIRVSGKVHLKVAVQTS